MFFLNRWLTDADLYMSRRITRNTSLGDAPDQGAYTSLLMTPDVDFALFSIINVYAGGGEVQLQGPGRG